MSVKIKKIKELVKGDIFYFSKNDMEFVCVENASVDANCLFITTPEYYNDKDLYSYSSGGWEHVNPETEVILCGHIDFEEN